MSEDWLDTGSTLPVPVPVAFADRLALVEQCWGRLEPAQRAFLAAWRECGFNARATSRKLLGYDATNGSHTKWMQTADYRTVANVWRAMAADNAVDRDRLLARQDSIVETLLIPKPVLYQGIPVRDTRDPSGMAVLEEVEAGAASRANEVLMKAAGLLKDKEVELNIGVIVGPPTLSIQVLPMPPSRTAKRESVVIDAKFTEVPEDDWLGT